jgi:hypothetical protein
VQHFGFHELLQRERNGIARGPLPPAHGVRSAEVCTVRRFERATTRKVRSDHRDAGAARKRTDELVA